MGKGSSIFKNESLTLVLNLNKYNINFLLGMINKTARLSVSMMLHIGCNIFYMFPYEWDPVKYRLVKPSTNVHLQIHTRQRYLHYAIRLCVTFRLLLLMTWEDVPIRTYQLHSLFIFAYALSSFCFLQFELRRHEIMVFSNAVFAAIDEYQGNTQCTNYLNYFVSHT